MKRYDEIKEIITQRYGLTSLEAYKTWLTDWRSKGGTATQEEADQLSPDNINCRDFWKVCEDVFGVDSICNAADGGVYTNNMDANRLNFSIAQNSGLVSWIDLNRFYRGRFVEYGPGLGCAKNYVEVTTRFDYFGFDVNPRIPDIKPTTEDGYLPSDWVTHNANTCTIVFSSNVLQHVSRRQRIQFFADAWNLLQPGGFLLFNLTTLTQDPLKLRYMVLYGQFILIPEMHEVYNETVDTTGFTHLSTCTNRGFHHGFVMQKVPSAPITITP